MAIEHKAVVSQRWSKKDLHSEECSRTKAAAKSVRSEITRSTGFVLEAKGLLRGAAKHPASAKPHSRVHQGLLSSCRTERMGTDAPTPLDLSSSWQACRRDCSCAEASFFTSESAIPGEVRRRALLWSVLCQLQGSKRKGCSVSILAANILKANLNA